MSGGLWNYRDATEPIPLDKLEAVTEALRACFHEVDWSESDDTNREEAGRRLYNIIGNLGNELWGDEASFDVPSVSEVTDHYKTYDSPTTHRQVASTWYRKP